MELTRLNLGSEIKTNQTKQPQNQTVIFLTLNTAIE